ncbi:hypothetical protein CU098_011148, partial [Rhizopus stolonifer]
MCSKGFNAIPNNRGRFSCGFMAPMACRIEVEYRMYNSLCSPVDSPNKNWLVVGTEEGLFAKLGAISNV